MDKNLVIFYVFVISVILATGVIKYVAANVKESKKQKSITQILGEN